jgi:hypothetical protein
MSANITLPRDVALQIRAALRFQIAWNGPLTHKGDTAGRALAALDAALAEPEPEPEREQAAELTRTYQEGYEHGSRNARQEPATDEQIVKAGGECAVVDNEYLLDFRDGFRAAERFHGIKKEDKT